jgi:hypothetical protein
VPVFQHLCDKGGVKIEAFVRGCILWRYQALQVPDLRNSKERTEGKALSVPQERSEFRVVGRVVSSGELKYQPLGCRAQRRKACGRAGHGRGAYIVWKKLNAAEAAMVFISN